MGYSPSRSGFLPFLVAVAVAFVASPPSSASAIVASSVNPQSSTKISVHIILSFIYQITYSFPHSQTRPQMASQPPSSHPHSSCHHPSLQPSFSFLVPSLLYHGVCLWSQKSVDQSIRRLPYRVFYLLPIVDALRNYYYSMHIVNQ